MIQVFLDRKNKHTFENYLSFRGREIRRLFGFTYYDELHKHDSIKTNTVIFLDLEMQGSRQLAALVKLTEHWDAEGVPGILNHPAHVLDRYELLRKLYEEGINPQNVYLLKEPYDQCRFPVFIRHRDLHTGSMTPLLHNMQELKKYIRSFRLSSLNYNDLMIVEFVDAKNERGHYRKYAAVKIGDTVLPKHIGIDNQWHVKSDGPEWLQLDDHYEQELEYFMQQFPHKEWAERIFDIANVDYGRLDYGVMGNRPVAWEINLNPDFYGQSQAEDHHGTQSLTAQLLVENHIQIRQLFRELAEGDTFQITIPPNLITQDLFRNKKDLKSNLKTSYQKIVRRFPVFNRMLRNYRRMLLSVTK